MTGSTWSNRKSGGVRGTFPESNRLRFQTGRRQERDYNPRGRQETPEQRFPYADGTFDLVFMASVFPQMLRTDVDQYASEIARVLRPGGRCLVQFYLLNNRARGRIAAGLSVFDFGFEAGGCYVQDLDSPDNAIAYDEERVRDVLARCGLSAG